MAITDGEFFALFKRLAQKIYKDPSGTPGLTSDQLIRPQKQKIVTSNGAAWTRLYVNRAVYIWTPDYRQIDYVSGHHPGDLSADTSKPWNSSINNVAKLYAPGEWHVKTKLLTGDTEGSSIALLITDAALGIEGVALTAADIVGAPPVVATNPNRAAFATAQKNVVTPLTAVNLASLVVPGGFALVIKGKPLNAGLIWVGTSAPNAIDHTIAFPLDSGEPMRLYVNNANLIWIDADNAGEGVNISVEQ